jgi:predicted branched-subunit amino acid permease
MSITLYAMFIGLLVPEMRKSWKVTLIASFSILLSLFFNFYIGLSNGWSIILSTLIGSSLGILLYNEKKVVEEEVGI